MIYQFKVSLKGMSPPIWRRLQVEGNMTFYGLHEVLQDAFDWDDYHLHSFSMQKRNGKKVIDIIEPLNEEPSFFSFQRTHDEHLEIISDWFFTEKDRALYTYDFGDDWEHEIILEKIVEKEVNVRYPNCVKAMRLAPEEDSRGMWEEEPSLEEVDWRELTLAVNESFTHNTYAKHTKPDDGHKPFDWLTLIKQAKALNATKPWEKLADDQIFIVEDTEQFYYCSILGAGGQEFGLAVYLGDEGLQSLQATLLEESYPDIFLQQRSLLLAFVDRDELENDDYQFLNRLGLSFRGSKQWVQFRSLVPGKYPWLLDEEEGRILQLVLEQTTAMLREVEKGLFIPPFTDGKEFIGRVIDDNDPTVWQTAHMVAFQNKQSPESIMDVELHVSEIDMKRLTKRQTNDSHILLDLFMLDLPVQDAPGKRPYFPYMLVALDEQSGAVVFQTVVTADNIEEKVQSIFVQMIDELRVLPGTMTLKAQTAQRLAPVIKRLPILVNEVKVIPQIDTLRDLLRDIPR